MLPALLTHALDILRDAAIRAIAEAALKTVYGDAKAWWDRRRGRLRQSGNEERLAIEESRFDETIASLTAELQATAESINWERVASESREPAVESFIDGALSSAVESTSEAKRLMLGRLIAKRLETKSGTREEMTLRQALETIDKLTEEQLRLLAAINLVHAPPLDGGMRQFSSLDELEAEIRPSLFNAARQLKNSGGWIDEDFQTLVSVGAVVSLGTGNDLGLALQEHAGSIEQWLNQLGIPPYSGIEGDIGTPGSRTAYANRFPTVTILEKLAAGRTAAKHDSSFVQRLDEITLTPLGWLVGGMVLEQLLGCRLDRMVFPAKRIPAAKARGAEPGPEEIE